MRPGVETVFDNIPIQKFALGRRQPFQLVLTGDSVGVAGHVQRRLVRFCQRYPAILAAIDTQLRQTANAGNGPLQVHGPGAAGAGRGGVSVHDANMTRVCGTALT